MIAIISILAAILFPVFSQAREKARQTSCASNLKQIGIGWLLYSQDYDGIMGIPYYYNPNVGGLLSWDGAFLFSGPAAFTQDTSKGLIQPYLKSYAIQSCPDLVKPSDQSGYAHGNVTGYGLNDYLIDATYAGDDASDPANSGNAVMASDHAIQTPTETILMADSGVFSNGQYSTTNYLAPPSKNESADGKARSSVIGRHTQRANVLWCDGHVKAMLPIYPTSTDDFGNTPAADQGANFGDILKQPFTGTYTPSSYKLLDYYYELNKS